MIDVASIQAVSVLIGSRMRAGGIYEHVVCTPSFPLKKLMAFYFLQLSSRKRMLHRLWILQLARFFTETPNHILPTHSNTKERENLSNHSHPLTETRRAECVCV